MIEIENLSKRFGDVQAVRDLSLRVPAGELFCLLGPNGAGKTTTIKVLTGLLRPTAGTVRVCGADIQAQPVAAKRRMGYVPDMPYLYDRLTAAEFLQFTGDLFDLPRAVARERTDRLFAMFRLDGQRSVLIRDLSHGFRQRLIYAATLLHEPDVLCIDEPLIGLDPRTIRFLKDVLRDYAHAGRAVLLTTHILSYAQDIADRVGIMAGGRLIAVGTTPELLARHGAGKLEDLFLALTGEGE
jgi:ABC-2 type transport system ATP-binding protein